MFFRITLSIVLMFLTSPKIALGKQGVVEETAVCGFYCFAKSHIDAATVLRRGDTLEASKNSARSQCNDEHGSCEVIQCYEENPYRYSCLAGRTGGPNRVGGFKTSSNNLDVARGVSLTNCRRVYSSACESICYTNFTPPRGFDETTH